RLLIIDPQNDFCDIPGAALPVPGADADMQRLAALLRDADFANIPVTLDSQASVRIERTPFWSTAAGDPVAPFTLISSDDVRAGRFRPRDAAPTAPTHAYLAAHPRRRPSSLCG